MSATSNVALDEFEKDASKSDGATSAPEAKLFGTTFCDRATFADIAAKLICEGSKSALCTAADSVAIVPAAGDAGAAAEGSFAVATFGACCCGLGTVISCSNWESKNQSLAAGCSATFCDDGRCSDAETAAGCGEGMDARCTTAASSGTDAIPGTEVGGMGVTGSLGSASRSEMVRITSQASGR